MRNDPAFVNQQNRLKETRRRIYQTRLIFSKSRLAKQGLKWLTFLGITVPLLTGGIVISFYTRRGTPELLVDIAGFLGAILAVATVWSLVDEWPRKSQLNDFVAKKFDRLYVDLENLQADNAGLYGENEFGKLERESRDGVQSDFDYGISKTEKERAWEKAVERYP